VKSERILKYFTRNFGAKIISLFFAFALWLHVTAQQGENQSFRLPLSLTGIPDSLTIIHDYPKFVEVTIRGSRSKLMRFRLFGRFEASVDLSKAVKGRNTIPISAAVLNLPEDIDPREVTVDNPKVLILNFEQLVSRQVPVRIAWKGEIPKDVIIDPGPVIIPAKVKITGAMSVVNGVELMSTKEIDIRGKRGRFTQEIELQSSGRDVDIVPDKVLVEMDIYKRASRTLANIPPTLLQDDESLDVDYNPKVVSLTIEGREDIIQDISADDVSVILNIATRKPGTYMIEPEVIVPLGIDRYFLDSEMIEVKILKAGEERKKSGG
jgi:YbbR domain-containing protein